MAKSLKIAHVITTGSFAGTERYAVQVGTELARRGHDVTVIGGEPATMREIVENAARAGVVGGLRWRPGGTAAQTAMSLVRGGRYDIVHSHITKSDFVSVFVAAAVGGRRVSTRHITAFRGYTRAARALARPVRAMLARELAVSEFTSAALEQPADAVLLNGVPPVEDDGRDREKIVLVAQRLAPEKQTAIALRAWAASGLPDLGWRLVVAGAGDEKAALENVAVELDVVDSVEFPGWLSDMDGALRRASLFLAPAPSEPCGLTILEAMAHGVPVVAAGSGGNLETIGQEPTAALFAPGDVAEAARYLRTFAEDEGRRRTNGKRLQALQRRRLSLDVHVDALAEVYHDVLSVGSVSSRRSRAAS
jgi:glycosyltransferase involved in cell wall biosynthesis